MSSRIFFKTLLFATFFVIFHAASHASFDKIKQTTRFKYNDIIYTMTIEVTIQSMRLENGINYSLQNPIILIQRETNTGEIKTEVKAHDFDLNPLVNSWRVAGDLPFFFAFRLHDNQIFADIMASLYSCVTTIRLVDMNSFQNEAPSISQDNSNRGNNNNSHSISSSDPGLLPSVPSVSLLGEDIFAKPQPVSLVEIIFGDLEYDNQNIEVVDIVGLAAIYYKSTGTNENKKIFLENFFRWISSNLQQFVINERYLRYNETTREELKKLFKGKKVNFVKKQF